MNKETRRKLIHILISLIAFLFLFLDRIIISLIIVLLACGTIVANKFPRVYNYIIKQEELDAGMLVDVLTYTLSMLILTLMFDLRVAASGILALGFGDGFAQLIGKKYGKLKLYKNKTLAGSASVFVFSLITALISFTIIPVTYSIISVPIKLSYNMIPIACLVSSTLTMIAELLTKHDNISVPLTQSISLSILLNLL